MKKLFVALMLMTSAFAGTLADDFETLLQEKLTFGGEVEVTYVSDAYVGYVVSFNVTSYGDTRGGWCYIVEEELQECNVDWFKK